MSGLSRTPGKRVGVNSPPRVRIPLSPPSGDAIEHTYGSKINSPAYLSKFVSLSIPLTAASATDPNLGRYSGLIRTSLQREGLALGDAVIIGLALFAEAFDATVRDIQKAIRYFKIVPAHQWGHHLDAVEYGFAAIVRSLDEQIFVRLFAGDTKTYVALAERIGHLRLKHKFYAQIWAS